MGGHIRIDKDLEDDPRVVALTDIVLDDWVAQGVPDALRESLRNSACNAVLGGLYRLWRYADTHLKRYDRIKSALHGVAAVTGLSVTVLRQFPCEWLVEHSDGTVELPGYTDKNALIDKENRKEKTKLRVRKWRQRQRGKPESDVTPLRNVDVTQTSVSHALLPGPGPGPGPGPTLQPGTGTADLGVESRKNSAPHGALASAQGHLARRLAVGEPERKGTPEPPPPTNGKPVDLEVFAREMAATGTDSGDIARMLEPRGVTLQQVRQWLANTPPAVSMPEPAA